MIQFYDMEAEQMSKPVAPRLLSDPRALINQIEKRLQPNAKDPLTGRRNPGGFKGSAVLFLLTEYVADRHRGWEPCLVLNKRSRKVLQPGDLCCPGGGFERRDRLLAHMLRWPGTPLVRWAHWQHIRSGHSFYAGRLSLLLATGLRESWEEMGLNPLKVRFLGPLDEQRLIMFDRIIYPLAGWIPKSQRFSPNWEVDRIVHIPLRRLLDNGNYGRYRLDMEHQGQAVRHRDDFPCFIHHGKMGDELLWGATFRITMDFLKRIFDFSLPDLSATPVFSGRLGRAYLNGSLMDPNRPSEDLKMDKEDY